MLMNHQDSILDLVLYLHLNSQYENLRIQDGETLPLETTKKVSFKNPPK